MSLYVFRLSDSMRCPVYFQLSDAPGESPFRDKATFRGSFSKEQRVRGDEAGNSFGKEFLVILVAPYRNLPVLTAGVLVTYY